MSAPRPPPNAPRGPAWNQWRAPNFRETIIPAKRDANGDEKEPSSRHLSSPSQSSEYVPQLNNDNASQSTSTNGDRTVALESRSSFGEQSGTNPVPALTMTSGSQQGAIDDVGDPVGDTDSDESSDDDGMDLDEDDFEATKLKFDQQTARLRSQLVDLSDRQYRATTPLEQLARLAKITASDLPGADELSSVADVQELEDEDASRVASRVASQQPEEVDQDLLTPKEEDAEAEDVVMEDSSVLDNILPQPRRRRTLETINLPYLIREPLSPRDSLQEHLAHQNDTKVAILERLRSLHDDTATEEENMITKYTEAYRYYKDMSRQFDDQKLEKERQERQKSADTDPATDVLAAMETPTSERSGRLHKFSSEYDIQKVLKESEETARVEQEKLELQAQRARDSMEKEAMPPDLLSNEMIQRRVFKNTNNFRNAWHLTEVYGYQPPADDFSVEEHKTFLETFKETPKKWGEIAARLPGRTYQHCIHHYYAHKWDGRFRETKGRRKRGYGRGRGGKVSTRVRGAALMADLGPKEEDVAGAAAGAEPSSSSGRPRRAAASRTVTNAVETEGRPAVGTPAKKTTRGENGEAGSEKPVKRRKGTAEKVIKKSKTQPLATTAAIAAASVVASPIPPAGSPVKTERDVQFRPSELSGEDLQRVEEASLLAGLQAGTRVMPTTVPVYHTEAFYQPTVPVEPLERPRTSTQSSQQRSAASSYWSVPEQQDFVKFLGYFGTDFAAIANHMGTKTQTMVSA